MRETSRETRPARPDMPAAIQPIGRPEPAAERRGAGAPPAPHHGASGHRAYHYLYEDLLS